jgi:hypothetical protein
MKLSTALVMASMVNTASAFTAIVPRTTSSALAAEMPDPVDKSLKGIDSDDTVFDPTSGGSPALIRNNNDEVWVPQVRFVVF